VRIARKHLGWYAAGRPGGDEFRARMNRATDAAAQAGLAREFFGSRAALPLAAA